MTNRPSIAIVGAGAVGGYYGARLAQSGLDVHFLLRSDYEHVRRHGLAITSVDGDFALAPSDARFYNSPTDMPAVNLIIVALKSTHNDQFAKLIPPLLHDDTAILTLQNGLGNEDALAELFGARRVLGGVTFVCINRPSPGVIHHTDHGYIRLGEFITPFNSARARHIADLFTRARIPCEVVANLLAARWEKLVWNIPFNGLGAVLDATTDQLIATDAGVEQVTALMNEVVAIAASQGIGFSDDLPARKIHSTRSMGRYMSSMQVDRRCGRPMEIDAIFSRPLSIARDNRVPAPRLELLEFALRLINNASSSA